MTPEIKQRIEQIRNGEVPEGYTKTKHGIFPSHWKVDKLGNYLQEYRELTNEIEKHPVYSSSRKGLLPQSQYYDKREVVTTNLGYKKVPNGYVTYRHMSDDDIFRFNKNTTEGTVLVSSEYPVFNCNTNGNIDYILPLLNDSPRFKYYCRIQKMGGTRTRLYYKNLCQYTTAFPPLKEQRKIANILSAHDKVIECYEKKIEQLKRMKKYYLQNMFPKRGETVPKIRFKGFTDPWGHKKLGDITASYSGGTPTAGKSEYYDGAIPFIRSGEIGKDHTELFISEIGLKNSSAAMVNIGDILYALYGATSGEVSRSKIKGAINQAILAILPNRGYDPEYLMQWLRMKKEPIINAFLQGGQGNLSGTIVKGLTVNIPCYDEQVCIGQYFSYIDNLITLHQRKLDEEKKKKKALQQLLLTGIVRV